MDLLCKEGLGADPRESLLKKLKDIRHGGGSRGDLNKVLEEMVTQKGIRQDPDFLEIWRDWAESFSPWELHSLEERVFTLWAMEFMGVGSLRLWGRFLNPTWKSPQDERSTYYAASLWLKDRCSEELDVAAWGEQVTLMIDPKEDFVDPQILSSLERKGWVRDGEVTDQGREVLSKHHGNR